MDKKSLVRNRKVPFWADKLRETSGADAVLQAAREAGLPASALRDTEMRIAVQQEALFLEQCAELSGDPVFGLNAAIDARFAPQLAGYVFRYSQTLRDGVQAGGRLMPAVDPTTRLNLVETDATARLEILCTDGALIAEAQHREFYVFGLLHMFRQAAGAALVPQELWFQHARAAHTGLVARKAGCSVRFGQHTTAILLRPSALDLPLATCDPALMNLLLRHGEQVLQNSSNSRSLVGQIEKTLIEALPQSYPDANAVARSLGLSRRTMTRRLGQEGTTFQRICDNTRMRLAKSYLKDPGFSLSEIAYLLCFSDQAGFTSTFRRWTGTTPGALRSEVRST